MSASYLRLTKSETRELAEREQRATTRFGQPVEWHMRDSTFFAAFVVIAALIGLLALALR